MKEILLYDLNFIWYILFSQMLVFHVYYLYEIGILWFIIYFLLLNSFSYLSNFEIMMFLS